MTLRIVRQSKYRHVFGTPAKRDQCYDNLKLSVSAWDTNLIKVNPRFFALNWNAGGGGAFAVVPLDHKGKLEDAYPLFNGHAGTVLDTDFHPFNDHVIASGAEDCKVMVWKIPEDGMGGRHISTPEVTLSGHLRKVGTVMFHPTADNVLASAGADYAVKFWDVEKGMERAELSGHGEIIQSMTYSWMGDMLATTCKDKVLRVFDVRAQEAVAETPGHQGVKGSRAVWLGEHDKICTVGFSRTSDRQIFIWDLKNMKTPLRKQELDMSSGILMPFFDKDNQILYLAGKGDGNISYYEYDDTQNSELFYLSDYKSSDPQRGIGFLPKRAVDVSQQEIARAYRVHNTMVEPISFRVPRKADSFQADIFPPCVGDTPALTADEFFDEGKTEPPVLVSLEDGFVPTAPREFVAQASENTLSDSANGSLIMEPQTDAEFQDAYKAVKAQLEAMKAEMQQKELRIKQLEGLLAAATLSKE
ncbi:hypothetical protein AMAG_02069 [Allomyces macrogynus ATCC 38327]|uniref:Coronin n=1 Tax=Allomyces macrogynus (strain ATCC 38327) TaxID=578462 RepID=A0A0L0S1G8_ALLM3|nr:hypothetical protein AMAG_02069 [Allomyces macrogynus ATCC 38327]|eukprot:KNE56236.1 hypothetical protein AMAG_02069 [Allomyces macrogynus ATCC 38327]